MRVHALKDGAAKRQHVGGEDETGGWIDTVCATWFVLYDPSCEGSAAHRRVGKEAAATCATS